MSFATSERAATEALGRARRVISKIEKDLACCRMVEKEKSIDEN
jgi:hypothetical protein